MEGGRTTLTICLPFLALAVVAFGPLLSTAQPHPYPMGFSIYAESNCTDSSGQTVDLGEQSMCHLKSFNVCMELMYYPQKCMSRVKNTTVLGKCGQHGIYANSTVVSLSPGNDDLPQTVWVVNFNSTNPMLPVLKDGLACSGYVCSKIVATTLPKHALMGDVDSGMQDGQMDAIQCQTNITVQAYGWEQSRSVQQLRDEWDCDEQELISRCN
eukprot:scpid93413/ scgid10884/ 